jgi:hypothetical protein
MAESDGLRTYLETMGMASAHQDRVQQLLALYLRFPDARPTAYFVSEYPEDDGTRVYESLWLFSDRYAMEARYPGAGDERIDFICLQKGVRHVVVEVKAYDLATPSPASRMRVEAWFTGNRLGELRASGANCEALRAIVSEHLLPNLAASEE